MDHRPFALGWRPALDGVRGVAIVFVVLCHVGLVLAHEFRAFRGGFIGVDVFFTLSGFLITGLLLEEYQRSGTIRFAHFYRRRVRRLLPAAFGAMFVITLFDALNPRVPSGPLGFQIIGVLSVASYWFNWFHVVTRSSPFGMSHFWTLSVEEQYYLAWPLALFLLLRFATPRTLGRVLAVTMLLSTVLAATLWIWRPSGLLGWQDTFVRAGQFTVGAAAVYALHRGWRPGRWIQPAGLCGAAYLVFRFFTQRQNDSLAFGGYLLLAVASCLVIVAALDEGSVSSRLLSTRGLRYLGRISYSLYLWNYPVFQVVALLLPGIAPLGRVAIGLGGAMVATVISYYAVEAPFRIQSAERRRRSEVKIARSPQGGLGGEVAPAPPGIGLRLDAASHASDNEDQTVRVTA